MTRLFKTFGTPLMALAIAALFAPALAQAGDVEALMRQGEWAFEG